MAPRPIVLCKKYVISNDRICHFSDGRVSVSLGHISSWTFGLGDVCKTSRWPSLGHPAILNIHVPLIPPKNFPSTLMFQMSFEEFYDGLQGSHFGYLNGKIIAALNIHDPCSPSSKIKFHGKKFGE